MSVLDTPAGPASSAPGDPPVAPSPDGSGRGGPSGPGARRGLRARLRRWAWPLVVVMLLAAASVTAALAVPTGRSTPLDPDATTPHGARAVARLLAEDGVTIRRARTSTEAVEAATTGDATILVTFPEVLGPAQLARLRNSPADLVLLSPDHTATSALARGVAPSGTSTAPLVTPGCTDPGASAAGSVAGGGMLYAPVGDAAEGATFCYPEGQDGHGMVVVRRGGRTVTVLGNPEMITNDRLALEGDAALALHVLGARRTLVWYDPDPLEARTATVRPGDLLPRWVPWVAVQFGVATVVALLWRARRLGRVVPEPLPVVVRAAETVEGRGRLDAQHAARGRAAAVLRLGCARRLAQRLGMPPGQPPEVLADRVAAVTGLPAPDVHARLHGPPPGDDAGLVRLATDLDALEASVTTVPGRPGDAPDEGASA